MPVELDDILFDDAFADASQNAAPVQPETPPTTTQTAQPAPQATAPEFFLETPTGSKYKSRDEVINGIAAKDDAIEYLRNFAMSTLGVDPLKVRQGQPQAAPQPESYLTQPERYVQDLSKAYETQDPRKYAEVQNRLVQENLNQVLAPVQPLVQKLIREEAIEQVTSKMSDFRTFYGSEAYKAVLDEAPTLKNAIAIAEGNIEMRDQLPDLYTMARKLAIAKTNDQLLETAKSQQAPQTTVRPTATPASPVPTAPAANSSDWKTNPAARKAYLEQAKGKGFDNLSFSSIIPNR